jgi:hypothetical protein
MVALPVLPAASVALAVMVWVPTLRVFEKLPPVPIWPSRLEVQIKLVVQGPVSGSVAEPVKVTAEPEGSVEPAPGAEMITVGGLFNGAVMFAT